MSRLLLKIGLIFYTVIQAAVGLWLLLFPRTFYDTIPTVDLMPPFSEHPFRDFGAATLGLAVVLGAAAVFMEYRLVCVALLANLVFAVAHFIIHATHLEHLSPGEAVVLTVVLALEFLILAGLFAVAVATRPERGSAPDTTR